MKNRSWAQLIAPLILLAFPLFVDSDYYRHVVIMALMWVVIGSSWNLLAGFTGQVSFGHAIFFGIGAYSAGLLKMHLGLSPWWGMLLGGPMAMAIGFVIGWICFRLRGPYFALATIAVGEIFHLLFKYFNNFTGGMEGILIIQTFRSKLPYYFLALGLAGACVLTIILVMRSKWGYYFISIREDQDAAESMGISAFRYKSLSLMISSFFTGLAGAFYMNYMAFIDPEVVYSLHYISIMAILVGIIGGVGTIWGPAVGAFIMVLVQETFRSSIFGLAPDWVSEAHALVFGVLVMFVILFMANGVVGDWKKITHLFTGKKQAPSTNGSAA
ncbi:MAG: branched-chain amino acid ABC transporter permease [Desulfovibrionaceae bacterium]|nr:branched-chain amino acid ABC transporter permease [Desulfovibrionaceae bacterium]MDD4951044.1 branched-chain amino acid ABC transporter permease [Desulfovibrionaceae bacterium]